MVLNLPGFQNLAGFYEEKANGTERSRAGNRAKQKVGWVERSETHHFIETPTSQYPENDGFRRG